MPDFTQPDSYRRFEFAVKRETRYVYNDEVRQFLAAVVDTSQKRKDALKKGSILFRGQRGYTWRMENAGTDGEYEVPDAFEAERMVPKAEFVGDGRVNPKGIPCLYLATTADVAVGEVRPWVGSYISVAQFKVMRDLVVVNCTNDKRQFPNWVLQTTPSEISPAKREEIAWGDIGYAFSRPVTPDQPVTEYVPTQILAEAFRANGLDGIVYQSLLGDGLNVALFDCADAELINCALYETYSIKINFDQCANRYFITKHLDQAKDKQPDGHISEPSKAPGG